MRNKWKSYTLSQFFKFHSMHNSKYWNTWLSWRAASYCSCKVQKQNQVSVLDKNKSTHIYYVLLSRDSTQNGTYTTMPMSYHMSINQISFSHLSAKTIITWTWIYFHIILIRYSLILCMVFIHCQHLTLTHLWCSAFQY